MPRTDADDEGAAGCGRGVDHQGEDRLPHGHAHPGTYGGLRLRAETVVRIGLATEGDDHPEHRDRLVHDRERLPLELAGVDEARLDPPRVVPERGIDHGYDGQGEQGERWIDPVGDEEHAAEGDHALENRRQRDDHRAHGAGEAVDLVHQGPRPRAFVEARRETVHVPEEVAPEVQHHPLVEPRGHVLVQHGDRVLERSDQQTGKDERDQQRPLIPRLHRVRDPGRERLRPEDRVDDDRERPGGEQTEGGRDGDHHQGRRDKQPVRPRVVKCLPQKRKPGPPRASLALGAAQGEPAHAFSPSRVISTERSASKLSSSST
jgi:hypothetical protein